MLISDQKQFYRRFQIPRESRINLKKIYFDIEANVDDGTFYLFNFVINSKQNKKNKNISKQNFYEHEVKNFQQLTKIVRDTFQNN